MTVGGLLKAFVQMLSEGLFCLLRQSKMDQLGRGKWVVLFSLLGSGVCPVCCLEGFLVIKPDGYRGLLVHQDGCLLFCYQYLAIFRCCL